MIRPLEGNDVYEKVNKATGDLAMKLKGLIAKCPEDRRITSLARKYIEWWHIPFSDPRKDVIGRSLWDTATRMVDEVGAPTVSRLERAGYAVGTAIGKTAGITANVTIGGATATHRWMKGSAATAIRAGSREFWRGLKATARATGTRTASPEGSRRPFLTYHTDVVWLGNDGCCRPRLT